MVSYGFTPPVYGALVTAKDENKGDVKEFVSLKSDLNKLKYALGEIMFDEYLSHLQSELELINNHTIKCLCISCTDYLGPNYPNTPQNGKGRNNEEFMGPSDSKRVLTIDTSGTCRLYDYFVQLCKVYGVQKPGSECHPSKRPGVQRITECLGTWIIVTQVTDHKERLKTIIPMLFHIYKDAHKKNIKIDEWYSHSGVSLIPTKE